VKIIRHILFFKILRIEIEHAWHPTVVRTLRVGGQPLEDPAVRRGVLVYIGLIVIISIIGWMALNILEPDETWTNMGHDRHEKLMDCASGVAATINGVGPGLGAFGAMENYARFQSSSKMVFVFLMLLGRLEIFPLLVLLIPAFWRGK
jgi:trk/ktr system potassium uptake protein